MKLEESEQLYKRLNKQRCELLEEIVDDASSLGVDWNAVAELGIVRDVIDDPGFPADEFQDGTDEYKRILATLPGDLQAKIKREQEMQQLEGRYWTLLAFCYHRRGMCVREITQCLGMPDAEAGLQFMRTHPPADLLDDLDIQIDGLFSLGSETG